ncbi:MAG: serine hydroxymethyltransferase [Planctomycetota bacterium]
MSSSNTPPLDQPISAVDPEIAGLLQSELERQQNELILIPSENHASRAVLEAQGSVLSNKYAEGYPDARYYNGCRFVDAVEKLAIERVKALFGAEHANVQPLSGTTANMAVYYAALEHGDNVLAMDLNHGGHLSHGQKLNFSGRQYHFFHYGVNRDTEHIDLDAVRELAKQHRPKMIVAGASSYSRTIDFEAFGQIARECGAMLLGDMAHISGLVAGGEHPSPVPHCDFVTSTTQKMLRGPRGAFVLCREEYKKKVDRATFPGVQAGPLMNTVAGKAVCFLEASQPAFNDYARQVVRNAKALAETLQAADLRIVSGGTDNHLLVVDLTSRKLTGRDVADRLEEAGIVCNKNVIPFDPNPPKITSGVRFGTPAITSRGLEEDDVRHLGQLIAEVIDGMEDDAVIERVRGQVRELAAAHPVYTTTRYA